MGLWVSICGASDIVQPIRVLGEYNAYGFYAVHMNLLLFILAAIIFFLAILIRALYSSAKWI